MIVTNVVTRLLIKEYYMIVNNLSNENACTNNKLIMDDHIKYLELKVEKEKHKKNDYKT